MATVFSRAKMYLMTCLPASFTFTGMSTSMHRILTMICSPATYSVVGQSITMIAKKIYTMICLPAQYIFTGLSTVITVPLHSTWNTIVRNTSSWNIVVRNITNWIKKSQGQ
jgi:RsiW-degrading membrane proteinase PrsW (M82 family)